MVKVLISVPDALARRIDRRVRERGTTRSAYIAELAERDLEQELGPGAHPEARAALARARELIAEAGGLGGDTTQLVRDMRDERTRYLIERESR